MANHKSAIKRIRVNERRRLRNRLIISRTRTVSRTARETIQGGNVADARIATIQAIRELDKAASKGIIHRNQVARRKSRLAKRLNALEASVQ